MKYLITLLAVVGLFSCAPAVTRQELVYDGFPYTLVLDEYETPCGRITFREGCTALFNDGKKPVVYLTSISPKWVVEHELEHVKGMRHGGWRQTNDGWCTNVYASGSSTKYSMGDIICNSTSGEWIIKMETRKWN